MLHGVCRIAERLLNIETLNTSTAANAASFNADVPPLEQWLGRARLLIDRRLAMSPSGRIEIRSRPYVARYQGNWKFQIENINDSYHFMHTHRAFAALQAKYGDSTGDFGLHKGGSGKAMREQRFRGRTWDIPGGHGQLERPVFDLQEDLDGEFSTYYRGLQDRYGADESTKEVIFALKIIMLTVDNVDSTLEHVHHHAAHHRQFRRKGRKEILNRLFKRFMNKSMTNGARFKR
jgi:phenylpropionate dioxygenase-like ring-hydroxylating dioxygenase large terminal subunit